MLQEVYTQQLRKFPDLQFHLNNGSIIRLTPHAKQRPYTFVNKLILRWHFLVQREDVRTPID